MLHSVKNVGPNSLYACLNLPNTPSTSSPSHSATSSTHVHVLSTHPLAPIPQNPLHKQHTCFHSMIIAGMFNIACLLISSRPLSVLSHALPLTFCPSPVPFTINPVSMRRASFSPGFLIVQGSRSTTPCKDASLTRSACLRRPNVGPCHRPVVKFLEGRNGLGYGRAWACGGMREARGALEGTARDSDGRSRAESVLGVVSAPSCVGVGVCAAVGVLVAVSVEVAARFGNSAGGG
jgi:hypothetical protein